MPLNKTIKPIILRLSLLLLIFIAIFWAAQGINIDLERMRRGMPAVGRIIALMFPPDWSYFQRSVLAMVESVQIAVIGTGIAGVLAIPIGFLAASNLGLYKVLVFFSKQVLNAIRTFPELIFGIFFVAAYGPGPLAGVMAIGINSIGMLGKLNAEIVENIDKGPLQALEAVGANKMEIFRYAVMPQILPELIATILYRFELNLRAATILGLVGAGGIGVILLQSLQFRRWSIVGMALLIVVVVVTVIDYSSSYLRRKII